MKVNTHTEAQTCWQCINNCDPAAAIGIRTTMTTLIKTHKTEGRPKQLSM